MSVRPVFALMGNDAFMPSKDAMRSSVPQTCSNTLRMPGCLRVSAVRHGYQGPGSVVVTAATGLLPGGIDECTVRAALCHPWAYPRQIVNHTHVLIFQTKSS